MKNLKIAAVASLLTIAQGMTAGGLLTNTNQNVTFLRNPARDAAIGIDGVYSNPAGVAFLNNGIHLSFNIQNAHQTRTIETGFPLFAYNVDKGNDALHKFKGEADAPVIPSIQAAYNTGNWSFQFNFALVGGGGKCTFDNGLGSFEQAVSALVYKNAADSGGMFTGGYTYNTFMQGRQYYFGGTLGAANRLTENLSVYGGLRVLYATCNYYGYVKDIKLQTAASTMMDDPTGTAIELNCDQTGWGVAPIIGVDYKTGILNLAAKYEFKTRMRLKNKSVNNGIEYAGGKLDKYVDGEKVAEDSPALLTVGAQVEVLPQLRLNAGWHHYFDVDTKQYTKDMLGDTNEYLFGAEYDISKRVQVSAGAQKTCYDLKDAVMNDLSFNVSSYSFGFGVGVNVTEKVKINAAYFQTNYDTYDMTTATAIGDKTDSFTRTNRVIGVGVDIML